nr:hypothetical protein [Sinisalibacter aestuarii]
MPLEALGKLLGHSRHQTTMRHAQLMDDPLRHAKNDRQFGVRVRGAGRIPFATIDDVIFAIFQDRRRQIDQV